MITQNYICFDPPISLAWPMPGPRLRLSDTPLSNADVGPANRRVAQVKRILFFVQADVAARTLTAHLSSVAPIVLYGPQDFAAACGDTMEDHAARVLQLLGPDPAATLQSLIDKSGTLPTPPARIPREIANWRAKAILAQMGLLDTVDAYLAALPEPEAAVAKLAWNGDAKILRTSPMVAALALALALTPAQLDAMFLSADAIQI